MFLSLSLSHSFSLPLLPPLKSISMSLSDSRKRGGEGRGQEGRKEKNEIKATFHNSGITDFLAFLRQLYFLKKNLPTKISKTLQTKLSKLFILPEDSQWGKSFHQLFHFLYIVNGFGKEWPAEHQAHFLFHEAHD